MTTPDASVAPVATLGDGGFQQRLQEAQHAQDVHGLPGSGIQRAPGMRMADPRTQGIAGAARFVQSLLGVRDGHCVDVDAWQRLSKEEMLARQLDPKQVEATSQQYGCGQRRGVGL
ncbi:hypothetical protein KPL74_06395 [Bacillus sp. NP157]|nr:hypothetical protein KPL74_06395 [Bacillus sp. NP157]